MRRTGAIVALLVAVGAGLGLFSSGMDWLEHARAGFVWPHQAKERGVTFAVIAGLAVVVYVGLARHRPRLPPPVPVPVPPLPPLPADTLAFYGKNPWHALLMNLAGLAMFGTAMVITLHQGLFICAVAAFALVTLLLAGCLESALLILRQRRNPGPLLQLDARGVQYNCYRPIPWHEVAAIHMQPATPPHTTMVLGVRDAGRFLLPGYPFNRLLRIGLRRRGRIAGLPVLLSGLAGDTTRIHEAAIALRLREPTPLLRGWAPNMSDAQIATLEQIEALRARSLQRFVAPDGGVEETASAFEARMDAAEADHNEAMRLSQALRDERFPSLRRLPWLALVGYALAAGLLIWDIRRP